MKMPSFAALASTNLEDLAARMGWPSFRRAAPPPPAARIMAAATTPPPPAADDARMLRLLARLAPGAVRPGETLAALEARADAMHRAMPYAEAMRHLRAGRNLEEARQHDAAQAARITGATPAPTPAPSAGQAAPPPKSEERDEAYFWYRGLSRGVARAAAAMCRRRRPRPVNTK